MKDTLMWAMMAVVATALITAGFQVDKYYTRRTADVPDVERSMNALEHQVEAVTTIVREQTKFNTQLITALSELNNEVLALQTNVHSALVAVSNMLYGTTSPDFVGPPDPYKDFLWSSNSIRGVCDIDQVAR